MLLKRSVAAALFLLLILTIESVCISEQKEAIELQHTKAATRVAPFRQLLAPPALPLDSIKLPPGFSIELYSQDSFPARFLTLGQADGNATIVYVSSTGSVVTALVDRGNGSVSSCTLLSGLSNPNGIVYDPKTRYLYVAETRNLSRHEGADAAALAGCKSSLLRSTVVAGPSVMPQQAGHSSRALQLGPADGKLYLTVAAPFNVAPCQDPYCTIHRIDQNGSNFEVFARGIRNAAGFEWNPLTGGLMFAGMERDWLGDNMPDDILAAADPATPGTDFGWPYCHWVGSGPPEKRAPGPGRVVPDPDVFPAGVPTNASGQPSQAALEQRCKANTPLPIQALGPHVAPLGVLYWAPAGSNATRPFSGNRQQWPAQYDNSVFVGQHGSWNRDAPIGYRIANVKLSDDGRTAVGYETFAEGWLGSAGQEWGRPVGLLRLPDGSMLVADDSAQVVYRISYSAKTAGSNSSAPDSPPPTPVSSAAVAAHLLALLLPALLWLALHA